ncbi:MAG: 3',5'-cyclic-nucleotide phosphodiesterase [Myxococcales bacterium]|nr:3',5'-cyclic-nucleotide phosphodiesterase [Myxococcales bacterium]
MELRVLGCHGGESRKHRSTSFLLDGRVGLDAGATSGMLTLEEQLGLDAMVVSHAHLDHVRDLASLADNRCQGAERPLVVAGTPETLRALKEHFFNNVLWPDFTNIPLVNGGGPTVVFQPLEPEVATDVAGISVKPVLVSHTIESAGFILARDGRALVFSGDTGPTERLWAVARETAEVRAILHEVSFPDELEWLARVSGHHTPATLAREMQKLGRRDLPWLLYHIKPNCQAAVERELARLHDGRIELLDLDETWSL